MAKYVRVKDHKGRPYVMFGGMYGVFMQFKKACIDAGVPVDIIYGWRGEVEQNELKAKGLSKAEFGKSPHNFGLAFDYCPLNEKGNYVDPSSVSEDVWNKIGVIVGQCGLTWGGTFPGFPDEDHAQNPDWKELTLNGTCPLLSQLPDDSDIEEV
jgi:hypothetical protein